MTPYWTGSTPKRRSAPVSEGPSGALGATEAGQDSETTPAPVRDAEGPQNATESVEWGVRFVSGDGAVTTGYTDEADAKKSAAYWEYRGDPGTVMRRTVTFGAWDPTDD